MASNPPTKPPPSMNGNGNGSAAAYPSSKAQTYARPMYRPTPPKPRRRSRRGCCCACFLWTTLFLLAIIFLAAIAGGIFYVIYRPRRPSFSVTTLRLSAFNVTAAGQLTSKLDIAVSARNPNKKMAYLYDPVDISVTSSGASLGVGSFPAFDSVARNTTTLKATVTSGSGGNSLDTSTASDLRKKTSIPLEIGLDTKAGVKFGGLKTKKIGVRVACTGIDVPVPKGKSAAPSAPTSSNAACKAQLRIKIWKWKWYL